MAQERAPKREHERSSVQLCLDRVKGFARLESTLHASAKLGTFSAGSASAAA
jgi:hypothetical protein